MHGEEQIRVQMTGCIASMSIAKKLGVFRHSRPEFRAEVRVVRVRSVKNAVR